MLATAAALAAYPGHMGFHMFWPAMIIGPLMFLVIVGLLVALIVRRRRGGHAPWASVSQSRSAEQILADRFAKGDIEETEYRARLEVLRANRPEA